MYLLNARGSAHARGSALFFFESVRAPACSSCVTTSRAAQRTNAVKREYTAGQFRCQFRSGFGGPTVYHAQHEHCILCNAQGRRVNHTSGKKSRKGATIEVGYSEGCVRAHAARRARCIFRKVVKLISIVRFWSHVTYLPPTGGGAGYWRVEEEFSRLQLDG